MHNDRLLQCLTLSLLISLCAAIAPFGVVAQERSAEPPRGAHSDTRPSPEGGDPARQRSPSGGYEPEGSNPEGGLPAPRDHNDDTDSRDDSPSSPESDLPESSHNPEGGLPSDSR